MRIAFVYLPGRLARLEGARTGKVPTDFFYGAIELEKRGHEIGYFELLEQQRANAIQLALRYGVRTRHLPIKTYSESIDAAWRMRSELGGFDVVVATTNASAFSLGIWKKLRCFAPPIVGIICGLLNYPLNKPRIAMTRSVLNQMQAHLFGKGEFEPVKRAYDIQDDRLQVNCFGVDLKFWNSGGQAERDEYVLSVGNDSRRDYLTLLEAAKQTDRRFVIVTKRELPEPLPPNVDVIRGAWDSHELDDSALRELYRKAFCVVVPLQPGVQPSGQSVTLQAMACGTPVVLSQTQGLWEDEFLVDKNNILLVPPESPVALAEALNSLHGDNLLWNQLSAKGRLYVEEHGSIEQFARRLEVSCEKVVEAREETA
jgi:glycosyltransferase involved in cell wall biosynthesis